VLAGARAYSRRLQCGSASSGLFFESSPRSPCVAQSNGHSLLSTFLPLLGFSFPSLCSFNTLWTLRSPFDPDLEECECEMISWA
jgi:hypothetical protein